MNLVRFRLSFLSLLALALIFSYSNALAAAPKYKITFQSAQLLENNHVGNEWSVGLKVNNQTINEGSSTTVTTASIALKAVAQENDSYPDVGTASKSISVSSLKSGKNNVTLKVTVVENRGRYSHHTATWQFNVVIQKI